jgi:hypothetical protein
MGIELPENVREMFRQAGSKGGQVTVERHGAEHYAKISSAGGKAAKAKRDAAKLAKFKENPE